MRDKMVPAGPKNPIGRAVRNVFALADADDVLRVQNPARERPAMGFFTDTTVCIGCKACEVACKQWNQLPADGLNWTGNSYDNTAELSGTTWRHVKFVEQFPDGAGPPEPPATRFSLEVLPHGGPAPARWLMMSDVCKHCA